jgi:hypothetical protein
VRALGGAPTSPIQAERSSGVNEKPQPDGWLGLSFHIREDSRGGVLTEGPIEAECSAGVNKEDGGAGMVSSTQHDHQSDQRDHDQRDDPERPL